MNEQMKEWMNEWLMPFHGWGTFWEAPWGQGTSRKPDTNVKAVPAQMPTLFFFALSIYLSTLFFKVSTLESKNGKIGHTQIKWLFKWI